MFERQNSESGLLGGLVPAAAKETQYVECSNG
jgi:hypothetical protein